MGKTYRKDGNFKKARRDRNFRKSKKFKQLRTPWQGKPSQTQAAEPENDYEYTDIP